MTIDDSNARAPAKLTASLLARKGTAAPAGFGAVLLAPRRVATRCKATKNTNMERGASAGSSEGKVPRLTLRLDEARHLRLRLTAAHLQLSRQDILTEALDRYLDHVSPEILSNNCVCLAPRARGHGGLKS